MKLDRTFRLRGNREYLHSTSLFDDILKLRRETAKNIDMKFHRRTTHQVRYIDTRPTSNDVVVADWRDDAGALYVIEREEPILDREPYDEPALARMFTIEGREVRIPKQIQPFTRIEAIVAGFKRLLHECRDIPSGSQYAFVRVRLRHCPEDAICIDYARNVGAFPQGDISEHGAGMGQIFFGVWQ
jgi:hypothetical protein